MIDPTSREALEEIVQRESRSLLSYIAEAYPWTSSAGTRELATLQKLIRQEAEALASLGRYLVRKSGRLPYIPAYPMEFTTSNFVSLNYLLPRLIETQQIHLRSLEATLPRIKHEPTLREVERFFGVKKMTLAGLESLVPSPEPASA